MFYLVVMLVFIFVVVGRHMYYYKGIEHKRATCIYLGETVVMETINKTNLMAYIK